MKKLQYITSLPAKLSGLKCPACSSTKYKKNGNANGVQRYVCKCCNKNFRDTTHSTIHRIHKKQLIEQYVQCLNLGYSLRKAAKEMGISLATAFAWRHKLLAGINRNCNSALHHHSVISAFAIPYSEKGAKRKNPMKVKDVKCLVNTDQSGRLQIHILDPSHKWKMLIERTSQKSLSYIPSRVLPVHYHRGAIAENNISLKNDIMNIHESLRQWIERFRGVATKYLHHYWAWFVQQNEFIVNSQHHSRMLENSLV